VYHSVEGGEVLFEMLFTVYQSLGSNDNEEISEFALTGKYLRNTWALNLIKDSLLNIMT
jgi:hypothetical protein